MRVPSILRRALLSAATYITRRPPDVIIGDPSSPYMLRWHLIPRNRFANIYLHHFLQSDDDSALHDHPWSSVSIILDGCYAEKMPSTTVFRKTGDIVFRKAEDAHCIMLGAEMQCVATPDGIDAIFVPKPVTTLLLTGPKTREWGFHCRNGWRPWQEFCDPANPGQIGKGCGE